jgi:hypothetical protein
MTIYAFLNRFCKPSQKMEVLSAPGHMKSTLPEHNTTSDLSYSHGPSAWTPTQGRGKIYRGYYTSTTSKNKFFIHIRRQNIYRTFE